MRTNDVVLCSPVRTPIGTYAGSLKSTPATELGATVIRESLKRSGLAAEKIEALVMGQVIQPGNKMSCPDHPLAARHAARWIEARHRHALYRWWSRDRLGAGNDLTRIMLTSIRYQ